MSKGIGRYYKVSEDGELIRLKKFCPRCGPGIFMAEMYDRIVCGHCGFTEFKKKPSKKPIIEESESAPPRRKKEEAKPKGKRKKK